MKLTPLDLRQRRFEPEFRGYRRAEVEAFLESAAQELEDSVREGMALKDELRRAQTQLEQHLEREKTLQETMVTAQRISEDVKATARKEAEVILAEAEVQAQKITAGASGRLVDLVTEINELKRQKIQFESQLASLLDAHQSLLATFKTAPTPDLAFFVPKKSESA